MYITIHTCIIYIQLHMIYWLCLDKLFIFYHVFLIAFYNDNRIKYEGEETSTIMRYCLRFLLVNV